MIPNTQSGLNWTSIAVFQAENDGGVHFWIIGYVQPQKVPIKPPKIAILRPNLNKDVPNSSECATVAQYSSFKCKNDGGAHFGGKKSIFGTIHIHFGHFGQSEMAENGPNGFPMPNNLGIYTKIRLVGCSEPKLQVWLLYGHLSGHKWLKWPFWPLRSF